MKKLLKGLVLGAASIVVLGSCGGKTTTTPPVSTPAVSTPAPTTPSATTPVSKPTTTPVVSTPSVTTPVSKPTTTPVVPTTGATTVPTVSTTTDLPLQPTEVIMVGDSTMCSFNDSYYLPRYGYGTQMSLYFNEMVTINNLALSGRSSKSFVQEDNYNTMVSSLDAGDYLIIGFGHNDEKSDDASRFTDASKDLTDPTSFQYSLYENYIRVAIEKGATPILATPIVRATSKNDYSGSAGHVTATGNYTQSIIDLGQTLGVTVIDLTALTSSLYSTLGYDQACYYHAVTSATLDADGTTLIPNFGSVDNTHLNVYGAKQVAYMFATALAGTDNRLGKYVIPGITAPTKEADLVPNPEYTYVAYKAPNLSTYTPSKYFTTTTPGWYGTAFGDCGGDPVAVKEDGSSTNGYYAMETSAGVFKVGQHLDSGSNKGKFTASKEGFAFLFQQLDKNVNFELTVSAKVLTSAEVKQAGFGIMLRDNAYLPAKDAALIGNYVAAGLLCNETNMVAGFSRTSSAAITSSANVINALYKAEDTAELKIARQGQVITIEIVYAGQTYTEQFLDFPLFEMDNDYMYVGMFANRGTTVEFTNVNLVITGTAGEA